MKNNDQCATRKLILLICISTFIALSLGLLRLDLVSACQNPLCHSPNKTMFDYNVLQRFNIPERALPAERIIINYSVSPFEQYRLEIVLTLVVFAFLLGILIHLLQENRRRKKIEKALSLTRISVDAASDALFWMTPDARIVDVNAAACRTLGYTREELLKLRVSDVDVKFSDQVWKPHFSELRQRGTLTFESEQRTKDGRVFPVEIVANYVLLDGEERNCAFVRDITGRKQAEQQLLSSQSRLNNILDSSRFHLWAFDGKVYLYTNQEWFNYTGQDPRSPLTIESWESAVHPDDRASSGEIWFKNWEAKTEHDNYCRLRRHDGVYRYFFCHAVPVSDDQGRFQYFQGFNLDITEQKLTEDALRAGEEKYRRIVETANEGILSLDVNGRITFSNRQMADMLGYEVFDLLDQKLEQFITEDKKSDHQRQLASRLQGQGAVYECCFVKKDGGLLWALISARASRSKDGSPAGSFGMLTDITAIKQAQAELRQHRDHLEEIVSERTAELLVAKEQAESASRAKSEFLAVMSHEIRTPLNGVMGLAHLALQTDLNVRQRDYLTRLQQSAEILMATINDILNFSKIEAGKLTIEHVDYRLDDVLDDLSSLVAARAQERGLELVFDTDVSVPRLLVGDPQRLGQVLLNLVGNAIKFTMTGEVVLQVRVRQKTPSRALLEFSVRDTGIGLSEEQITRLFQPFSQADTSTSRRYGGTGLGLTISQRLVKMLGGEIGVTSQVGVGSVFSFAIVVDYQLDAHDPALLTAPTLAGLHALIVDHHPATLEFLKNILESFSLKVSTAQNAVQALNLIQQQSGSQFDLVLVDGNLPGEMDGYHLARRIKMDSETAQTHIILLTSKDDMLQPVNPEILDAVLAKPVTNTKLLDGVMQVYGQTSHRRARPIHEKVPEATLEKLHGRHVLLVEDNEINQLVATEILQQMGLVVSIARNGEQAVMIAREEDFAAILMDINMPGMDGYQAAAFIRNNPTAKSACVPIIAMTAYALHGDDQKALSSGMNDYVSKPIDILRLANVLVRWLARDPSPTLEVAGAASQTPAPPQQTLPPSGLLDVTGALERLNNDENLYRRILGMFSASGAQDLLAIRAALKNNDPELARRLAHTLKGLAGTVGAEDLHDSLKNLEMAIVEGVLPVTVEPLISLADQKLAQALTAITALMLHENFA